MRYTDANTAADIMAAVADQRTTSGGWVRGCCPLCVLVVGKEDRRYSLGLNTRTGGWHCFRCGQRGRLRDMVEHVQPEPQPETHEAPQVTLPDSFVLLGEGPGVSAISLRPFRRYLVGRGLDQPTIQQAGIGACLSGRFGGRVVVPIRNRAGELLGFVARHIHPQHPVRYLNSSGAIPGIFNEAALYINRAQPLLIVEGCFDALPYWPDAVALMGKASTLQRTLLRSTVRNVVVAMDGDAWREGEALAWSLAAQGVRATSVRLPPMVDPGSMQPKELQQMAAEVCVQ